MPDLPSRPWSPLEVEVRMAGAIIKHEEAVVELKRYVEDYANARRNYEVKRNQSILVARQDPTLKTDAQRLAWATLEAADLRFLKDIAEGSLDAQRIVCRGLESEQNSLRTLARSSRDLLDQPGFGGSS